MGELTDYFVAEPAIAARVESEVTGVRHVGVLTDLSEMSARKQVTPAVYVAYTGDRLGDRSNDGRGALVSQRFLVILAVRYADGDARDLREGAGPIMVKLIRALQGFVPSEHHRPLRRIDGPRPLYERGGFAFFPIAFEAQLMTTA